MKAALNDGTVTASAMSPALEHLVTISKEQLAEELPFYDKNVLHLLEEADAIILGEDMHDSLPRHALIRERIVQIGRGEK